MVGLLVLLFVVVPIVELAAFVQVSHWVGALPALALVVVFSITGGWLVKREGVGMWRRARSQLAQGQVPAAEIVNGLLILFAGALMLTPGFLTDVLGLVLLIPPTRAVVRIVLMRRFEKRIRAAFEMPGGGVFGAPFGTGDSGQRVSTGRATYRGAYDVNEVGIDDQPPGSPSSRPELGRY